MGWSHIYIFYAVQMIVSGYALWRGGAPERWVAIAMVLAALFSSIESYGHHLFRAVNFGQLSVDLIFMLILTIIAVRAARFWPIYMAGMQLCGIGIHGVRAYDIHILPLVYSRIAAVTAYPMLIMLVVGTARHVRRLEVGGAAEIDWSTL